MFFSTLSFPKFSSKANFHAAFGICTLMMFILAYTPASYATINKSTMQTSMNAPEVLQQNKLSYVKETVLEPQRIEHKLGSPKITQTISSNYATTNGKSPRTNPDLDHKIIFSLISVILIGFLTLFSAVGFQRSDKNTPKNIFRLNPNEQ